MALAGSALRTIVCAATLLCSVANAVAVEPGDASPALIGLTPGADAPQPPPSHRKLWIALGVISGVAVVGAIVAVGVTVGTSSHDNSVFNDWGTLTVTRR
jgi:hypothetical protein